MFEPHVEHKKMYYEVILSACMLYVLPSPVLLEQQRKCYETMDTITCEGMLPDDIHQGVKTVIVNNMVNETSNHLYIGSYLFAGRNWDAVTRLSLTTSEFQSTNTYMYIMAHAFVHLNGLQHLEIHRRLRTIDGNALVGLHDTVVLDFSDSGILSFNNIIAALNGSEKIKNLQSLIIQSIDLKHGLNISRQDLVVLATKNISYFDFSNNIISGDFDAACDTICLRPLVFKCKDCNFMYSGRKRTPNKSCQQMRLFDATGSNFHTTHTHVKDKRILVGTFIPVFNMITGTRILILNKIISNDNYDIRNVKLLLVGKDTASIQNISIAGNKIQYLDIEFQNFPKSIIHVDLSSNGMMYLQPNILFENNSLETLDLSHNKLNTMANSNSSDFGHLLRVYKNLQHVDLSDNHLAAMPQHMFANNTNLQSIDLSHNELSQLEFSLKKNIHLTFLKLENNKITLLSALSMATLQERMNEDKIFQVNLRNNDIPCDTCECKDFIEWIVDAQHAVISDGMCTDAKGNSVPIDADVVSDLDSLCTRQKRIIIGTLTSAFGVAFLLITVFSTRRLIRRICRKRALRILLQNIREGQNTFRFVAFLASSGEDEYFVNDYVQEPLAHYLSEMTGTNRELICTGDRHFRLGRPIAQQMDVWCQKCGSVMFVISKAFCRSPDCLNEMHIAYVNRKPIILMFKERVDEENMPPLLRVIFKQYTRVVWKVKDGEYELSTSWENVCESLIDHMNTKGPILFN